MNYDLLNFVIASLALLVALYSIYYAHRCNRRKIMIGNGTFYSDTQEPPIAWFEIHNVSPRPITITGIYFHLSNGVELQPLLGHEPTQTYSISGPFNSKIPDIIPGYLYADELDAPHILQPYTSIELGYYFKKFYSIMEISVVCEERVYHFKKHQSFSVHFSNIKE